MGSGRVSVRDISKIRSSPPEATPGTGPKLQKRFNQKSVKEKSDRELP